MKVKDMTLIAMFAAIMAVCSWISIPAPVPFTLQTMAVFLAVGLLGGKRGTIAVAIYILLGAVGLPVFAGFSGGLGTLLGLTGGYIFGFLAYVGLSPYFRRRHLASCGGHGAGAYRLLCHGHCLVHGGISAHDRTDNASWRAVKLRVPVHYP